jgi:hypothetical protein
VGSRPQIDVRRLQNVQSPYLSVKKRLQNEGKRLQNVQSLYLNEQKGSINQVTGFASQHTAFQASEPVLKLEKTRVKSQTPQYRGGACRLHFAAPARSDLRKGN